MCVLTWMASLVFFYIRVLFMIWYVGIFKREMLLLMNPMPLGLIACDELFKQICVFVRAYMCVRERERVGEGDTISYKLAFLMIWSVFFVSNTNLQLLYVCRMHTAVSWALCFWVLMCAHLCAWLFAFVNIICRNERVKLWDFVVLIPIYVASQHSIVHTIFKFFL